MAEFEAESWRVAEGKEEEHERAMRVEVWKDIDRELPDRGGPDQDDTLRRCDLRARC